MTLSGGGGAGSVRTLTGIFVGLVLVTVLAIAAVGPKSWPGASASRSSGSGGSDDTSRALRGAATGAPTPPPATKPPTSSEQVEQDPPPPIRSTADVHDAVQEVLKYGYDASRNEYRWGLLKPVLAQAWSEVLRPEEEEPQPVLFADYGSNFGYFSLAAALTFPKALVFSIEGEMMKGYVKEGGYVPQAAATLGEVAFHESLVKGLGLDNNPVCKMGFTLETLAAVRMARMVFDVQVAMSIFHWLPIHTRKELNVVLEAFASLARITVLEFPNKHHGTQMNWKDILQWYGDREQPEEVIQEALTHMNVTVTRISQDKSFRPIFQIVNHKAYAFGRVAGRGLCKKLFDLYKCRNTLLASQCINPVHNFGRQS